MYILFNSKIKLDQSQLEIKIKKEEDTKYTYTISAIKFS